MTNENKVKPQIKFYLSEILGVKVCANGKSIGKLSDIIIVEKGTIPHIMEMVISRSFGHPPLIIPMEKIMEITPKTIEVAIESTKQYEGKPKETDILLRDFVIDKRVIDVEGREVAVVYDVKILQINKKFYVTEVDFSKYGLFRRLHLRWMAVLLNIKERTVFWGFVQPLPSKIDRFNGSIALKVFKDKLSDIPPVDFADILEEFDHELRTILFHELDKEYAADTLEELEPNVQREIVSSLKKGTVAELINQMTPGQAADLLSAISRSEKDDILELLDSEFRPRFRPSWNSRSRISSILRVRNICPSLHPIQYRWCE